MSFIFLCDMCLVIVLMYVLYAVLGVTSQGYCLAASRKVDL